jgi:hypothetical protein
MNLKIITLFSFSSFIYLGCDHLKASKQKCQMLPYKLQDKSPTLIFGTVHIPSLPNRSILK